MYKYVKFVMLYGLSTLAHGFDMSTDKSVLLKNIDYFSHYENYTPSYSISSFKKHMNNVLNISLPINDMIDDDFNLAITQYLTNANLTKASKLTELYELPFSLKKKLISDALSEFETITSNKDNKFIIVNIPEFTATGYELKDNTYVSTIETPVIVGKTTRKTPLIASNITHIKFNPTWSPPPTILKQDVFKHGKLNTTYIKKHKLTAYHNGEKIDIDSINKPKEESTEVDFENFTEYTNQESIPQKNINIHQLKFVQPSGTDNALGVLKFELDNNQNIYLHDTNQHTLFKERIRAYSSGCIRVQNYKELASWSLNIPISEIEEKINSNKTFMLKTEKIPVYIVYWPFTVKNKSLIFINDIYKLKYS